MYTEYVFFFYTEYASEKRLDSLQYFL